MNALWQNAAASVSAAEIALYAAVLIILLGIAAIWILAARRRSRRGEMRGENHRVSVRDIVRVDERRRLVLIRRDNMEHLLLTGGDTDLVVESFPDSGQAERAAAAIFAAQESGRLPKPPESLPRPEPRERENAYTARPQRLPRQNAAGAAESRPGAAEMAERPPSPSSLYGQEARRAAPRPAADAGRDNADTREKRLESVAAPFQPAPRNEPDSGADIYKNNRSIMDQPAAPAPQNAEKRPARAENMNAPAESAENAASAANAPYKTDSAAAGNSADSSPKRNAAAESESDARPSQPKREPAAAQPQRPPAGAYAPYLGYMPQVAPRPAQPQRNRDNGRMREQSIPRPQIRPMVNSRSEGAFAAAEQERIAANDYSRSRERRPDSAGNDTAALRPASQDFGSPASWREGEMRNERGQAGFDERRNDSAPQPYIRRDQAARPGQKSGGPLYPPLLERNLNAGGERRPPAPLYPAFAEQPERRGRDNNAGAFDLGRQNSRNNFSPIAPADDNDFDKILQDELLRAPNAANFANTAKK